MKCLPDISVPVTLVVYGAFVFPTCHFILESKHTLCVTYYVILWSLIGDQLKVTVSTMDLIIDI